MSRLSPSLIDICFNCTHEAFQEDLDSVLQRASANKVTRMIIPASSLEDSRSAVEIAERYPGTLYAGIGIHPHLARQWTTNTFEQLRELTKNRPPVKTIGETGLDYYRNYSTPQQQQHAFEQQIHLAECTNLPIFLHQRNAHEDFMALIKPHRDKLNNAVVHCFTGNKKELSDYLDLDMYIGITGWICDERRGENLQELVQYIPENRLLIETDAPYLLPRSLPDRPKSRRNEPSFLTHIANKVAVCRNVTPAEISEHTSTNTIRFFNLPTTTPASNVSGF